MEALVLALADPSRLAQEESWATEQVARVIGVRLSGSRKVSISPRSGWLQYDDEDIIWPNARPQLPPDQKSSRAIAESTIRNLTSALSITGDPELVERCGATGLLAPKLRPAEIALVEHPNDQYAAHWLYRATPYITLRDGSRAPIYGSTLTVRIGHRGQIASLHSNFRPFTRESVRSEIIDFPSAWRRYPAHHDHAEEDHNHSETPHQLVYLQEGDGIPQFYASPYYLVHNGHIHSLVSACEWSLAVNFLPEDTDSGTRMTAVVTGGSGDYEFNWGYLNPAEPSQPLEILGSGSLANGGRGETDMGRVSTVDLPKGTHQYLVNVRDAQTGAFRHAQQEYTSRGEPDIDPEFLPEFEFAEPASEQLVV